MGTITPYESAKGRRYRVRYRKPDHSEAEKRGFTTMREAELYLAMVTVSKAKGDYIDPASSKAPVRMFADSWLAIQAAADVEALVLPDARARVEEPRRAGVGSREISSIRRSEVQDWVSDLAIAEVAHGRASLAGDPRRHPRRRHRRSSLASNPAGHVRNLPRHGPGKRRVYLSHDQVSDAGGVLGVSDARPDAGVHGSALGRGDGAAGAQREPAASTLRRRGERGDDAPTRSTSARPRRTSGAPSPTPSVSLR